MRAYAASIVVKNTLESKVPALLTAAGLDPLDLYSSDKPKTPQQTALVCYVDYDSDDTQTHMIGLIVQLQLYAVGDSVAGQYHDVIFDAIKDNITADLLGCTNREKIVSDVYPIDQRGSGFIFFGLEFMSELDDCE